MTVRERLVTTMRAGVADRIPRNIHAWLLPQTEAGRAIQRRRPSLLGSARVCRAMHDGVTITEERKETPTGPAIRVRIETPVGTLTEGPTIEPHHGSRRIRRFFVKGPEDYGDLGQLSRLPLPRASRGDPDPYARPPANRRAGGRLVMGCTEDFPPDTVEMTFNALGQELAEYKARA